MSNIQTLKCFLLITALKTNKCFSFVKLICKCNSTKAPVPLYSKSILYS